MTENDMSRGRRATVVVRRRPRGIRLQRPVEPNGTADAAGAGRLAELRDRARREAELHDALVSCLEQVAAAAARLPAEVAARLDQVAAMATEVGLAVASEVLEAAIAQGLANPTIAVTRCLHEMVAGAEEAPIDVYLAPDDLAVVLPMIQKDPLLARHTERIRITDDPGLQRGAAVVECGAGRLIHDPREVLARISEEVRKELAS